jgi:hypothetical protein
MNLLRLWLKQFGHPMIGKSAYDAWKKREDK